MTQKHPISWTTYAIVAVISAAIGFVAIYAMTGGGYAPSVKDSQSVEPGLKKRDTAETSPAQTADKGQLNTGKMTAFVFKDAPEALPDVKFNNTAGEEISLQSFQGRVVLLNLWATWCAPCLKEMPHLDELQAKLSSEKFEVVAVSIDRGSPEKPRKFLKSINSKALNFYHDPAAELNFTLKAIGMPTTYLIDGQGREIGRLVGPAEWHSADAIRLIKAYLPNTDG